jgi:hypothetical protein
MVKFSRVWKLQRAEFCERKKHALHGQPFQHGHSFRFSSLNVET